MKVIKIKQIKFAALILMSIVMISGCGTRDGSNGEVSSDIAEVKKNNLPTAFSYIVPYDDIKNDGDELGDYRIVDGEVSMDISKSSYCTDKETIAKIYSFIDTDNMEAHGETTYEELNKGRVINFIFDKLYFVSVYDDNTVVTQTFYTEGEKYEQLADEYYKENGTYPPAISDGLWEYSASDNTYQELSKILLDLPEEKEP